MNAATAIALDPSATTAPSDSLLLPLLSPLPSVKKKKRKVAGRQTLEEWNGSVCVKIYPTRWRDKKRRKLYHAYTLAWHDAGKRFRQKFSDLEVARREAQRIAGDIANGRTARLQFSQADVASLLRCRELLHKIGDPALELVVSAYVESAQTLLDAGIGRPPGPAELARFFLKHQPPDLVPRNIPDVVTEYLAKKVTNKRGLAISSKWKRIRDKMLERFATAFKDRTFSSLVSERELDDWLDSLRDRKTTRLGLRARRNYLDAIKSVATFAKLRGYLAKDWTVLDSVSDPEPPAARINLYTPDELVRLLNKAESYPAGRKLVPFIAITAFAGVRHGEMNEEKVEHLDWADLDFDGKEILLGEDVTKTGAARTADMPDNLMAWLLPYRKRSGKICDLANTSNALCRLRVKAGITGSKRNALRKSFGTYKSALTRNPEAVADMMGNSPQVIRANYRRIQNRLLPDAERWFSIMPTRADLLPLFAWRKG